MSRYRRTALVRLEANAATPVSYSSRRVRHTKVRGPDRNCGRRRFPCRPRVPRDGSMNSYQGYIADVTNHEVSAVVKAERSTRNHALNRAAFNLGKVPG